MRSECKGVIKKCCRIGFNVVGAGLMRKRPDTDLGAVSRVMDGGKQGQLGWWCRSVEAAAGSIKQASRRSRVRRRIWGTWCRIGRPDAGRGGWLDGEKTASSRKKLCGEECRF